MHVAHARRRRIAAEHALRFVGQVQRVAAGVPFPAADVGQVLRAVEQRAVALERGDVGEQRQHLVRAVAAGRELRHAR